MNKPTHPFLFAIVISALCTACGNDKKIASTAAIVQDDRVHISTGSESEDIIAIQNASATIEAYPVDNSCAGPFRIGDEIPEKAEGFAKIESLEKKMLPNGKIYETPVYIYEIGNEGYVKVTPQYDTIANCTNDKIGEIFVYSDLFLTDKGVGAMSSVEEFASAYSDFHIRYEPDDKLFIVETPQLNNVQFIIDNEYCQGEDTVFTSNKSCYLQVSDFQKASYFTAIRIIKH